MSYATLYEYNVSLKNGTRRKGLYLCENTTIVEAAPLPGYSLESFDEAKTQLISLFSTPLSEPAYPSVLFALFCLSMKKKSIANIKRCGLLRSADELVKKPNFQKYKLKMQGYSLSEAIQYTSAVYQHVKTPLRIDCNRSWTFEQTLSYLLYFSPEIIEYIEEPTNSLEENLTIGRLTQHTIALDESLLQIPCSKLQQIASEVVFILKPTILGSLQPYLALPAKKYVLSSSYETGIGTRWLLNCIHLSSHIDPYVGCDTYDDFIEDPIEPPCTEEITWNVQLRNGPTLLRKGKLFIGEGLPLPIGN